jgi:hypothetical protein
MRVQRDQADDRRKQARTASSVRKQSFAEQSKRARAAGRKGQIIEIAGKSYFAFLKTDAPYPTCAKEIDELNAPFLSKTGPLAES